MYVGQTVRKLSTRFIEHKSHPTNQHLKNAFIKYGKDNFTIHMIDEVDLEIAEKIEDEWIDYFQTRDSKYGYNVIKANKSRAGIPMSTEQRNKISVSMKGRFVGEKHPMFGKSPSDETRAKLGHKKENHPNWMKQLSKDTKNKISDSLSGRKLSEEHKEKLSKRLSANPNNAKITLAIAGKIRELYSTGEYSHKELADKYGIKKSQVGNIVNNISWRSS
jgi:group I intron endonuclease